MIKWSPTMAHLSDEDDRQDVGSHLCPAASSSCEKSHMKLSHQLMKTNTQDELIHRILKPWHVKSCDSNQTRAWEVISLGDIFKLFPVSSYSSPFVLLYKQNNTFCKVNHFLIKSHFDHQLPFAQAELIDDVVG